MPKYQCSLCNMTYDKKEYEVFGKDFCSRDCMIAFRKSVPEKEDTKSTNMPNMSSGGGCCF